MGKYTQCNAVGFVIIKEVITSKNAEKNLAHSKCQLMLHVIVMTIIILNSK